MASCADVMVALMAIDENPFSDEEMAMILLAEEEEKSLQRPCLTYYKYKRFHFENFTDEACVKFFRFQKDDLPRLLSALQLKSECRDDISRIRWEPLEGLCCLLCRLAYPNRLVDMQPLFGRSEPDLSTIVKNTLEDVYAAHHDKLGDIFQPWIHHSEFAYCVLDRGAALTNIWGFIDGTLKGVCRPGITQCDLYSGHKHKHRVKYQHIMCPNGLVCHAFGPFLGRHHDVSMYVKSGVENDLQHVRDANGQLLAIYGDGWYVQRDWLQIPFQGANLTHEQKDFNIKMSRVHASVEWGFGKVSTIWAFVNYYANQKVFHQPIGTYFLVASLFTNAHTCLYGSKILAYFGLAPPSLEEYFRA